MDKPRVEIAPSQKPTVGRIVIFKLTAAQAQQINRRRTDSKSIAERIAKNTDNTSAWPIGAQAHIGNPASAGDYYPCIVVRVWMDEFGPGKPGINGQVFLDGNDQFWVTSAAEGNEDGQWHWPPRV